MSDVIDLAWIGTILRSIQAEQRTIRGENQLLRSALNEAITLIMQRIGNFEAYVDTRLDQVVTATVEGMAGIEARLGAQFEQAVTTIVERLDRIEGAVRQGPGQQ